MTNLGRRAFFGALGLLAAPLAADAQQAAKVARIGYLGDSPARVPQLRTAFLQGLVTVGISRGETW